MRTKLFAVGILLLSVFAGISAPVPERSPITQFPDYATLNPTQAVFIRLSPSAIGWISISNLVEVIQSQDNFVGGSGTNDDAILKSNGFGTNTTILGTLFVKGALVASNTIITNLTLWGTNTLNGTVQIRGPLVTTNITGTNVTFYGVILRDNVSSSNTTFHGQSTFTGPITATNIIATNSSFHGTTTLRGTTDASNTTLRGVTTLSNLTDATTGTIYDTVTNLPFSIVRHYELTNVMSSTSTNANTLFVREDGNDATAIRGMRDKAWRTLTNALKAVVSGDTVEIGAGRFDYWTKPTPSSLAIGSHMLLVNKSNVTIRGAGMHSTELYTTNIGDGLVLSNCHNIYISDLGFRDLKHAGSAVTALVMQVHLCFTNSNIAFERCRFQDANNQAISGGYTLRNINTSVRFSYFRHIGTTNAAYNGAQDGACFSSIGPGADISHNFMDHCIYGCEIGGTDDPAATTNVNIRIIGNYIRADWMGIGSAGAADDAYRQIVMIGNLIEPPIGRESQQSLTGGNGIIILANAEDMIVANNIVRNMYRGIVLGTETAKKLRNITITGNKVLRTVDNVFDSVVGITIERTGGIQEGIRVLDNYVEGFYYPGINLSGITNYFVRGNVLVNCANGNQLNQGSITLSTTRFDGVAQGGGHHDGVIIGNQVIASGGTNVLRGLFIGNAATNLIVRDNVFSTLNTGIISTGIVVSAQANNIELGNSRFGSGVTVPMVNNSTATFVKADAVGGAGDVQINIGGYLWATNWLSVDLANKAILAPRLTVANVPGLITNMMQVLGTNGLPTVYVDSNGVFNVAGAVSGALVLYATNGLQSVTVQAANNSSNVVVTMPTNAVNGVLESTVSSVSNLSLSYLVLAAGSGIGLSTGAVANVKTVTIATAGPASGTNFAGIYLTNQMTLQKMAFSGISTTNQLDFAMESHQALTNEMSTNQVWQLTNGTPGNTIHLVLYGATSIASNYTAKFTAPSGSSITWPPSLLTNGTYDFDVPSNKTVWLTFFVDRSTNFLVSSSHLRTGWGAAFGNGTNINLTTTLSKLTFNTTDLKHTLPPGAYLVSGQISYVASTATDQIEAIYRSSDGDYYGNWVGLASGSAGNREVLNMPTTVIVLTTTKTIEIHAQNTTATRGTIYGGAGYSHLTYVRLP